MALPKDPRGMMINLMYLVLTAMLALNVTREVLNAFRTIDDSIVRSNSSIQDKNDKIYESFDMAEEMEGDKVKRYNDRAKEIRVRTNQLVDYLAGWKDTIVNRAGGYIETPEGVREIKSLENIDATTELLVKQKRGDEIRAEMESYLEFLEGQVDNESFKQMLRTASPIQIVDPPKSDDNPRGDWSTGTFNNIPVVATVTLLSKFENDARNAESMVLEHLMSQIHAEDYKFDALTAIAVPKTSYALEGQEIEATIMLAAYNQSANPSITSSAGRVEVKDGVGTLKFRASGVGSRTVNGVIEIDKAGVPERYPFSFDYMVGTAGASLQLDKMNVMYIGVPNPITLSASGYNIEDVSLSMPGAKLTPGETKGTYIAHVEKQGTLEYTINAVNRSGQVTPIAKDKIRVKLIPPPEAVVANRASGMVPTAHAKASLGIIARLENFDFDTRFQVTSFRFVYLGQNGDVVPSENNGPRFTGATRTLMDRSRPGDKWIFENVRAVGPDGREQTINSITLTLN